jgi:pimeloyl-ACP methyl ester carboxylesterase
MIVWGDQDKIVPISTANVWKAALSDARLDVIKNCGHFVDMEQPEVLARLTQDFIDG